ncbi:probable ribonuclease 11 [Fukomys damarensis]|uniref:Putative ribonuclease 11 n=1 Tax=Fukomys damarensis TaxID=885580 RepID=A0A091E1P2_FUKDA|nr:probable ribonuclease 11 [Fukomys damarensis]XP_010642582.1 probable ribonuclease 11 [Fukomys damarensis]KFO37217.1 Putative ribonuclease 11 [Fukomys damarensis]
MEIFSLLLLCLGLILAEASESMMEIIKEEFAEEKMQSEIAKSAQEKETDEVLMNLTLFDKNASLSLSKNIMPSSLLTFRLYYSTSKQNSPVRDKECYNNKTAWRKVLEANGSCNSSNNFIHGPAEVIHRLHKACSCKCGQNLGIRGCESPELENTVCQLTTGKQFPRCQYRSVTSLKKILTVLVGHSLMSWLVSGSKL